METALVTTTINIPELLLKYAANARLNGHQGIACIVIGDRKSPQGTRAFCESLCDRGLPCEYLDIEDQQSYLERFPDLWKNIPFDCIQRRNIGILKAYEDGAKTVITIDDDNWITNEDFFRHHGIVGTSPLLPAIESTSGWFNVCSFLAEDSGLEFYHRGFPPSLRWREKEAFITRNQVRRRIAVNAGFWLDDPDVDATTRLFRQPVVRGWKEDSPNGSFTLEPGTWSPFNSQNTSLMREAIPAYYLIPNIGRYDDIWASYVINRIAQQLGHCIAFGPPFVRQARNAHNIWKDLDVERNGLIMTDSFCEALRAVTLSGHDYHSCFGEIVAQLPSLWKPGPKWDDSLRAWREKVLEGQSIWHNVFQTLGADSTSQILSLASAVSVEEQNAEVAVAKERLSSQS